MENAIVKWSRAQKGPLDIRHVLAMRDPRNVMAVRLLKLRQEHKQFGSLKSRVRVKGSLYENLVLKDGFFRTDGSTLKILEDHIAALQSPGYIPFFYDRFIDKCSTDMDYRVPLLKEILCQGDSDESCSGRLAIYLDSTPNFGHGSTVCAKNKAFDRRFDMIGDGADAQEKFVMKRAHDLARRYKGIFGIQVERQLQSSK